MKENKILKPQEKMAIKLIRQKLLKQLVEKIRYRVTRIRTPPTLTSPFIEQLNV